MPRDIRKPRPVAIRQRPLRARPSPVPASERSAPPRMRLAARRRRRRAILASSALALALFLFFGVAALSHHARFAIESFEVAGASELPAEHVRLVAERIAAEGTEHLVSRTTILNYPKTHIENAILEELPRVRGVHLSRESLLAQAVRIQIEERAPYAAWCETTRDASTTPPCFTMDEDGFVFAEKAPLSGAYVFRGGLDGSRSPVGQTFLPGHFDGIRTLLARLAERGYAPLGVDVVNEDDFTVASGVGWILKASFGMEPETLARSLELVLDSPQIRDRVAELEYVDLRWGNKVFYRMRGEPVSE